MRNTVVVTGAAGYIGSVLVEDLVNADYNVIGMDALRYRNRGAISHLQSKDNFTFHEVDVRDDRKVYNLGADRADFVIPLAALVGAPLCEAHPDEARDVNFESVKRLVARLGRDQKILFPNTNSGYGQGDMVTEASPLKPISVYGRSKCDAEAVVLERCRTTVFRLATVFGLSRRMRFDLMVNDFVSKLFFDKKLVVYEGDFRRNFVGVRDVSRAFLYAMQNDLRGVYNCGLPDANYSKLQLAETLADLVLPGRKNVVTENSGVDPDKRDYFVDNSKLLATGFEFKQTLPEAVRELLFFLKNTSKQDACLMRNVP